MNIKELIAKLLAGKELTADEKAFIEKYDPASAPKPDPKDDPKLAAKLTAAEKERDEAKARLEEIEASKLTETEKLQKQLDKAVATLKAVETERDTVKTDLAAMARKARIHALAEKHGCEDAEYLDYLAGKSSVDINDDAKADTFVAELKKNQPKYFKAPVKPGPGQPPAGKDQEKKADPTDRIGGVMDLLKNAPEIE